MWWCTTSFRLLAHGICVIISYGIEEKQREVGAPSVDASPTLAYAVNTTSASFGDQKHKNPKKDRPTCTHCGLLGHTKDRCYKIIGYPPHYNKKNKPVANVHNVVSANEDTASNSAQMNFTPQQYQQLIRMLQTQLTHAQTPATDQTPDDLVGMTFSANFTTFTSNLSNWIIDSGATSHITNSLHYYQSYVLMENKFVILPNGARVPVLVIGGIRLTLH